MNPKLDLKSLNPLIHIPVRLGIMTLLSQHERCGFNYLKTALDTSDGNLSTHITKLESAGYLLITKTFEKKIPRTTYRLTPLGIQELSAYLQNMRSIIQHSEG